ncbi:Uncharacterized protein dnm_079300 [Desulfonema magnum]|uniref:Uncharacterized protein n=1 Tax=Desulfonema magnum TaxID=45655 RepID=A0A975GSA1_9BACT|nr:Uncharacterized protein dnm_079300 [Desulfonema magnum]
MKKFSAKTDKKTGCSESKYLSKNFYITFFLRTAEKPGFFLFLYPGRIIPEKSRVSSPIRY